MRGLYVHIPFCVKKCDYCDFYSVPSSDELIASYVEAVIKEAQRYQKLACDTLYLGGGTPSLLEAKNLRALLSGIYPIFDLRKMVEATIEVNPESATPELLRAAKGRGINRVSIGVQSLNDTELKNVGRIHTADQATAAIMNARQAGFKSISADLIIGLPEQNWTSSRLSLEALTGLEIIFHYIVYRWNRIRHWLKTHRRACRPITCKRSFSIKPVTFSIDTASSITRYPTSPNPAMNAGII